MQTLLKDFISSLHSDYFKKSGFKKKGAHFSRKIDGVIQEVHFQSSSWNSSGAPIVFYINLKVSFENISSKDGSPIYGIGRIGCIVSNTPDQFELREQTDQYFRHELIFYIVQALKALPTHYEDIRKRALKGLFTPIPLPETWKNEDQIGNWEK